MARPRVLVSIPTTGWVHKTVVFALLRMVADKRYDVTPMLATHTPYVNNLHQIRNDFLNGPWDWWVTMDDDNAPHGNPLDLIVAGKDVVGFPTPVFHCDLKGAPGDRPWYFNSLMEKRDDRGGFLGFMPAQDCPGFTGEGWQEVDAVGSGCLLLSRKVMASIEAPFMREWNEDGTVDVGGDYAFSRRARNAGFSIWTHWGYVCQHVSEVPLLDMIEGYALMHEAMEKSGG